MSMDKTLTLDEQIEVDRPLREVYAYIAEFSRIQEWDPGVARGVKLTPGSPAVGSEYRIDMKAGFSLHYRIVELEPCARMRMEVSALHCSLVPLRAFYGKLGWRAVPMEWVVRAVKF